MMTNFYSLSLFTNPKVDNMYKNILCRYKQLTKSLKKKNSIGKKAPFSWSHLGQAIDDRYYRQYLECKYSGSVPNEKSIQTEDEKAADSDYIPNDGELYDAFLNSWALCMVPNGHLQLSEEELLEKKDKIINLMSEFEKDIHRDPTIWCGTHFISSKGHHMHSNTANYRIIRFRNPNTAPLAIERLIDPMKRANTDLCITFLPLRKCGSNSDAHKLCGYVPANEPEEYELDTDNGTDPISMMIKEKLVSRDQCGIQLLLLMGCFSYHLAKVFQPFVENIICIHPHCEIEDGYVVVFVRHFYRKLAQFRDSTQSMDNGSGSMSGIVKRAFYCALDGLKSHVDLKEFQLNDQPECMKVFLMTYHIISYHVIHFSLPMNCGLYIYSQCPCFIVIVRRMRMTRFLSIFN